MRIARLTAGLDVKEHALVIVVTHAIVHVEQHALMAVKALVELAVLTHVNIWTEEVSLVLILVLEIVQVVMDVQETVLANVRPHVPTTVQQCASVDVLQTAQLVVKEYAVPLVEETVRTIARDIVEDAEEDVLIVIKLLWR